MIPFQLRIQLFESGYTILRVRYIPTCFVIERFTFRLIFMPWSMGDYKTHEEATKAIDDLIELSPGKYFNDAFLSDPETLKLLSK